MALRVFLVAELSAVTSKRLSSGLQRKFAASTSSSSPCFLVSVASASSRRTFSSTTSESSAVQKGEEVDSGKHLFVIGGNGYLGSTICRTALESGLSVTSISRSGAPKNRNEAWMEKVNWLAVDAAKVGEWAEKVFGTPSQPKARAVISTLGTFGSDELMFRINGTVNVEVAKHAKASGIPRFIYTSAHNYGEEGSLPFLDSGKSSAGWGYFRGKRFAEEKLEELYAGTSAREDGGLPYYILRPSFVFGTRVLSTGKTVPLWIAGKPLQEMTLMLPSSLRKLPFIGAGLVPPVSADQVARVAVDLAVNPTLYPWASQSPFATVDRIIAGRAKESSA